MTRPGLEGSYSPMPGKHLIIRSTRQWNEKIRKQTHAATLTIPLSVHPAGLDTRTCSGGWSVESGRRLSHSQWPTDPVGYSSVGTHNCQHIQQTFLKNIHWKKRWKTLLKIKKQMEMEVERVTEEETEHRERERGGGEWELRKTNKRKRWTKRERKTHSQRDSYFWNSRSLHDVLACW